MSRAFTALERSTRVNSLDRIQLGVSSLLKDCAVVVSAHQMVRYGPSLNESRLCILIRIGLITGLVNLSGEEQFSHGLEVGFEGCRRLKYHRLMLIRYEIFKNCSKLKLSFYIICQQLMFESHSEYIKSKQDCETD